MDARQFRTSAIVLCTTFLSACASLKPDYIVPASQVASFVRVTSTMTMISGRVVVHGDNYCDAKQAKLAAILTNSPLAYITKKDATFRAASGVPITVSIPMAAIMGVTSTGAVNFTFTQPLATFTPESGKSYELEFSQYGATLHTTASEAVGASRINSQVIRVESLCEVTAADQGDSRFAFYLRKRL